MSTISHTTTNTLRVSLLLLGLSLPLPCSADILDGCAEDPAFIQKNLPRLPEHVRRRTCRPSETPRPNSSSSAGPNCFMAVYFWFNPSEPLRFVTGEEFDKTLAAYHPVPRHKAKLGDLVIFERQPLPGENSRWITHAAVFISDDIVWNKLGTSKVIDRGEGPRYEDPAWTLSTISALQEQYESATIGFYQKK